jgi:hypothetical protein
MVRTQKAFISNSYSEKEISKLDPNGPDYEIFVKALKHFHGLTAEKLKAFVERNGLHGNLVFLLPHKRKKTDNALSKN